MNASGTTTCKFTKCEITPVAVETCALIIEYLINHQLLGFLLKYRVKKFNHVIIQLIENNKHSDAKLHFNVKNTNVYIK